MTQLTLKEIPIEDAMKSGDAVLGWWDKYDPTYESAFTVVQFKGDAWVLPDIDDDGDYKTPSRVYELPGGVK